LVAAEPQSWDVDPEAAASLAADGLVVVVDRLVTLPS
jgi:hypothetical protein